MKAKKSYGQHFLTDHSVSQGMAEALDVDMPNLLEVGPGRGMLTQYLIPLNKEKFRLVEADRDMVSVLQSTWPEINAGLIEMDFLKYNLENAFDGEEFSLIGNFPYNISSQIIFTMIDNRHLIPEMIGMFQKEVGARIIAGPGSKTYGVISVLTQAYYEGHFIFHVPPESFNPPPRVDSIVIKLTRKPVDSYGSYDSSLFKHIVKTAFGQRRKMLRNTIKGIVKDKTFLDDPLFKRRPEQLGVDEFIALTNKIETYKAQHKED